MSRWNVGLILATLTGLGTAISAVLVDGYATDDLAVILGAIGAALAALFVDRDGDGIPPIKDPDARGYALCDALGAVVVAAIVAWTFLACGSVGSVVQADVTQAEIRADACGSARYDFAEGSGEWALGGYVDADAASVVKIARWLAVPLKMRLRLDGGTGDHPTEGSALWCFSVFGVEDCPLDARVE